jgi:hypothetical protein
MKSPKAHNVEQPLQNNGCTTRELLKELERLKQLTGVAVNLDVVWLPGVRRSTKSRKGRRLLEEVVPAEHAIYVYEKNPDVAKELLRHGFAEWLLNEHARPYRRLLNRVIEQFEELQYERKEHLVEALVRLMTP